MSLKSDAVLFDEDFALDQARQAGVQGIDCAESNVVIKNFLERPHAMRLRKDETYGRPCLATQSGDLAWQRILCPRLASEAIVDCGGSGLSLIVRGYQGALRITNKTGPEEVSIDIVSGRLTIDSTVTDGAFIGRIHGPPIIDDSTGTTDTSGVVQVGAYPPTQQEIRDSLSIPATQAPQAGSIDDQISSLAADVALVDAAIASLAGAVASGTLTPDQETKLLELWKRLSLDPADPFTATPSQMRTASGDIIIDLSGDGVNTSTGTRQ